MKKLILFILLIINLLIITSSVGIPAKQTNNLIENIFLKDDSFGEYVNSDDFLNNPLNNNLYIDLLAKSDTIFTPPFDYEYKNGKVEGFGATYFIDINKSIGRFLVRTQATGGGEYYSGYALATVAFGVQFIPTQDGTLNELLFDGYYNFTYWVNDNGFFQFLNIWCQIQDIGKIIYINEFYNFSRSSSGKENYEDNFAYTATPNLELTEGEYYSIWFAAKLYSRSYGSSQQGSATLIMDYYPNSYLDLDKISVDFGNKPPGIPHIEGIIYGNSGQTYNYGFTSVDPENDRVCYYITWGDGEETGWTGWTNSGAKYSTSHQWNNPGTYTISAKSKDINGGESNWGKLIVIMPKNKPFFYNFPLISCFMKDFQMHFRY